MSSRDRSLIDQWPSRRAHADLGLGKQLRMGVSNTRVETNCLCEEVFTLVMRGRFSVDVDVKILH